MIKSFKKILTTATFKDSVILFLGNVLSTVSGFFITVFLTKSLSPSDFGLFITAMAFAQLVTDTFELGLSPALIRFIPGASKVEKSQIIKTSLLLRVIISLVLGVAIFIFSKQISIIVFKNNAIDSLIQISVFGIILLSLVNWGQYIFQAERKFLLASLIGSSVNIFRLLVIVLLTVIGITDINNLYLFFQVVVVISLLIVLLKIDINLVKERFSTIFAKRILKFGLPVGFSFTLAAIYTRIDQILIFNYLGEIQAGIYGLAFRVSSAALVLAVAFNSVIAPRFASMDDKSFKNYFIKTIFASLGLSILSLVVILLAPYILPLLFGDNFVESVLPFRILMVGAIFFTLSSPFYSAILYRFKNPNFSLIMSTLSLILIVIMLNALIPLIKSSGAAIAVSCVYFIQLVIAVFYFLYLSNTRKQL